MRILKSKIQNPKSKIQINNSEFQIPNSKILQISISNTGPAIAPEQLDKIFDRFYQADTTYKKDSEGSGIGLALTKELVELHHGTIDVECRRGLAPYKTGSSTRQARDDPEKKSITTFKVHLPITKDHYKRDEIVEEPVVEEIPGLELIEPEVSIVDDKTNKVTNKVTTRSAKKSLPLLLIVEDNPDVTNYICSFMDQDYLIINAINGKEGWQKSVQKYPDLIISDVMMPEMDGFELCKKVKSDQRTSHIPVILLTAKADLASKIEGLEFGGDDYISKPFEADELKVRTKNLIEQRQKLREKFANMIDIKPDEIVATSMDEQFLNRLLDVFENHISEADYSIESFASEIGMSRSNLYRKIQALTNQSTTDFIRLLRLKRAAQLLRKRSGTVSEVAYAVGFTNLSHFSKIFRQQFGQTPSDFANL
jgi:DNA-binding response OmpR family regulator